MGTAIGVRTANDVYLAADRRVTTDGAIVSNDRRHVYDVRGVGLAVAGTPGDVQSFRDQVEDRLRTYEHRGAGYVRVAVLERLVGELTPVFDVACLTVGSVNNTAHRLLRCGSDGTCTDERIASLGSGGAIAIGQLEAHDPEATTVNELLAMFETIAERDPGTNTTVDVWAASAGFIKTQ